MSYLLDANVFIAAKNLHYGFDFCPAFWDWLIVSNEAERVYSVEKVGDELKAINDQLSEWAEVVETDSSSSPTLRSFRRCPKSAIGRTGRPTSLRQ